MQNFTWEKGICSVWDTQGTVDSLFGLVGNSIQAVLDFSDVRLSYNLHFMH
jgi:hypothetical protein